MFQCTKIIHTPRISVPQKSCTRERRVVDFFLQVFSPDLFFFCRSLKLRKMPILYTSIRVFRNPEHPTRLYRACLGLRKWEASKPSRFFPLPNSSRKRHHFSVLSIYMRICTLIQLNEAIFSLVGRGEFRQHPGLGFAKIALGFWYKIEPMSRPGTRIPTSCNRN